MTRFTAIDVFSGCGGLSTGLRKAGFEVRAAVELDEVAAATYRANHRGVPVVQRDIRLVSAAELARTVDNSTIHLLAGCAPCQGFSPLTRKNRKHDPRNDLVLEMARLVEELRPLAVFMENVPGLAERGKHLFDEFVRRLNAAGYYTQSAVVQMADYGVPQYRRRLVLLAGRGFGIALPKPTHTRPTRPVDGLRPWLTLRDVIKGRAWPAKLTTTRESGGPQAHDWNVVRELQPQTLRRLQAATPGETWRTVDESVRPECHQGGYEGFTNTYGRMTWDQTPVTMTSGCTSPCKGRFGHPDKRRTTISVREAALIQTFPESYRFKTNHMDEVCEMIGNAVPPLFAKTIGATISKTIAAHFASVGFGRRKVESARP